MARPRTFDEGIIVDKAMITFWKYGYEATSVGMLEKATGISRISIYNAFGDKSGLFLKALDKYSTTAQDYFLSNSFQKGGLTSIIELFQNATKKLDPNAPEHFGCLILNTILDIDSAGLNALHIISKARKAMISGLIGAMKISINNGEMGNVTLIELHDRAEFLIGTLWGGRMTARLYADVTTASGVTSTVVNVLKSWRK